MYGKYSFQMPLMPEFELSALADELYEQSDDDDLRLAELMRELPKETGDALCTSNLTNALQAFMYAFGYEPKIDISDLLLLQPSTMLLRGIVIEKVAEEFGISVNYCQVRVDKAKKQLFSHIKII